MDEKNLALVAAVADRDPVAVADWLKKGASVHYNDDLALRSAVYLGYTDMADLLLKNGANVHAGVDEPLFIAIKAKDIALIDLLLEKGASLQTALSTRKDQMDKESLTLITQIQTREAKAASDKRAAELMEKAKKSPRPVIKVNAL